MRILKGSWKIPIGRTYRGKSVFIDLNGNAPHIKVAGITGSGKSEFLKSLLYFICNQQSPKDLLVSIIDLKGGATFAQYELLPHVNKIYAHTDDALVALCDAEKDMWQRLKQIKEARKRFEKPPRFPIHLMIIDEGGEMSPADAINEEKKLRSACMQTLSTLVRVGREPGLRIVYGTQRPDKYTLPMTIRSQLETSICFRVREDYDSKIVLGHEGAEEIPDIPGRMILQTAKGEIPVQGTSVPDHVIEVWLRQYAGFIDVDGKVADEVVQDNEDKVENVRGNTTTSSVIDITRFLR